MDCGIDWCWPEKRKRYITIVIFLSLKYLKLKLVLEIRFARSLLRRSVQYLWTSSGIWPSFCPGKSIRWDAWWSPEVLNSTSQKWVANFYFQDDYLKLNPMLEIRFTTHFCDVAFSTSGLHQASDHRFVQENIKCLMKSSAWHWTLTSQKWVANHISRITIMESNAGN